MRLHPTHSSLATPGADLPAPALIGIGGPAGSGKTVLIERLIPRLGTQGASVAVVTKDLVTREDTERLRRTGLLPTQPLRSLGAPARHGRRGAQAYPDAAQGRPARTPYRPPLPVAANSFSGCHPG